MGLKSVIVNLIDTHLKFIMPPPTTRIRNLRFGLANATNTYLRLRIRV